MISLFRAKLTWMGVPDSFAIDACWRSEALQLPQSIGTVAEPHLDGIVSLPVVKFWSGRHASIQKVPCWDQAVGGFLHANSSPSHDYQYSCLRYVALRHIARH